MRKRTDQREWLDQLLGTPSRPRGRVEPGPKSRWIVSLGYRNPRPSEAFPPLTNNKNSSFIKYFASLSSNLELGFVATISPPQPNILTRKKNLLTLSYVCFVYESRKDMAVLDAEVVVRTKHICGYDGCVAASVLLEISPVRHVKTRKMRFFCLFFFEARTLFFF